MSFKISWLQQNPGITSLLDRHKGTARTLGSSQLRENAFLDVVDDEKRDWQAFRGLSTLFNSPFRVTDASNFRGLKKPAYERPYPYDQPPFTPPSEKSVHVLETEEVNQFDLQQKVNPLDDVLLSQYNQVRQLIRDDSEMLDAFVNGDYTRVADQLAQAAKEKLGWSPGLTDDFLRQHPDEASMVLADLGGAADLFNNKEAADTLTERVISQVEDEIFGNLAEKTAGSFSDVALLNEDFFREHPKAALYLIDNPEEVKRIDSNRVAEREFYDHVVDYENQIDPVQKAQALASANPAVGEDFWQDNENLALLLVAERSAGMDNSLQESALGFPQEFFDSTTQTEMLNHNQAVRGQKAIGDQQPLNLNYLREHGNLARLIVENPDFGQRLVADPDLQELIGAEGGTVSRVLQAYLSGLVGRNRSSWHWWA